MNNLLNNIPYKTRGEKSSKYDQADTNPDVSRTKSPKSPEKVLKSPKTPETPKIEPKARIDIEAYPSFAIKNDLKIKKSFEVPSRKFGSGIIPLNFETRSSDACSNR